MTAPCALLEWDSAFFHRRIARVTRPALTLSETDAVLHWCAENQIDCLYWLVNADDLDSIRAAEAHHFQLMDIRVTLRLTIPDAPGSVDPGIRPASAADLPALKAIARTAHTDSRFFADPRFPRDRSEELYAVWLERDFREGSLWVADSEDAPQGYITCQMRSDGAGQIGLLGVGAHARGRGIGARLVRQAVRWFKSQGASTALVVTQGRNARAQRLYQQAGFVTDQMQIWFHRWFAASESADTP
jgi:dTDP-4-amino-4,6-dideoxy-D-galactose acyltransferase